VKNRNTAIRDAVRNRQHPHQLGAVEQGRARDRRLPARQAPCEQDPEHDPKSFRGDGGDRRTGDPGVQYQHQQRRRRHIDEVDGDLHAQRQLGAGLSDQPAEHDVIGQCQWRGPDPDREVSPRRARDAFTAAHRAQQGASKRNLQKDERRTDQRRHDKTAYQGRAQFLGFAGAQRLRREGQRAHAQEGEQPEQAVENYRRNRHTAEQRRIAEPPDRDGGDDADQRRRQVRRHRRTGDGEDLRGRDLGGGS
jgi:hypothetical protein